MDNCKNWRELYEAQQKKFTEYYESTIEEYKKCLAAKKYELLLRQQELKLKIGDNIKVPVPKDNYCYGVRCDINNANEGCVEIKDTEISSYTLQPLIDKINSLQTYKLAEGDENILVSRDNVINILKRE